jgi:hypothetical protein
MTFHTTFPVYRRTSPRAAQFHKDVPYESDKNDLTHASRNGQHHFADGSKIVCRHLSLRVVMDALLNPSGKLAMSDFGPDTVESHVHPDSEKIYSHLYQMVDQPRIIDNTRLGANLCAVFEQMERSGNTQGAAFLESPGHSMALRLRIKTDEASGEKNTWCRFTTRTAPARWCAWPKRSVAA